MSSPPLGPCFCFAFVAQAFMACGSCRWFFGVLGSVSVGFSVADPGLRYLPLVFAQIFLTSTGPKASTKNRNKGLRYTAFCRTLFRCILCPHANHHPQEDRTHH